MFAGHSDALVLLLAGCAVLVGAHGYWHARRYWEGLPPLLDAFVSMAGFIGIIGAFVWAGRIGTTYGHPHAARVIGVAIALIIFRAIRTWIGKEQVRYRSGQLKKTGTANEL
jgi:divalent metal cation (Fe/Co/Zn/Cd) transporter